MQRKVKVPCSQLAVVSLVQCGARCQRLLQVEHCQRRRLCLSSVCLHPSQRCAGRHKDSEACVRASGSATACRLHCATGQSTATGAARIVSRVTVMSVRQDTKEMQMRGPVHLNDGQDERRRHRGTHLRKHVDAGLGVLPQDPPALAEQGHLGRGR